MKYLIIVIAVVGCGPLNETRDRVSEGVELQKKILIANENILIKTTELVNILSGGGANCEESSLMIRELYSLQKRAYTLKDAE